MTTLADFIDSRILHYRNPEARHGAYPETLREIFAEALVAEAVAEITAWPGYRPTPVVELDVLARETSVGAVMYKDESSRFGLGSFKALGGAYAVLRLLMRETGLDAATIRDGGAAGRVSGIKVVTATDGNHGRAVAWGAQRFGCRAGIYLHAHVSSEREQALRALGAEVTRVDGNYDDSVRAAAADAESNGWFVVSDTSWPGYTELPRYVMAGYSTMVAELDAQLPGDASPTHVFVQGGVGGLAAAVCAAFWMRRGEGRPRLVIAEPDLADCLYRSALEGDPVAVDIGEETVMAGLSCGEVSPIAWQILIAGADDFVTLTDDNVPAAMRGLADGDFGGGSVVAGESAVAGLCALVQIGRNPMLAESLALDADSRVLLIGTEGATDPAIYRRLTGREA